MNWVSSQGVRDVAELIYGTKNTQQSCIGIDERKSKRKSANLIIPDDVCFQVAPS